MSACRNPGGCLTSRECRCGVQTSPLDEFAEKIEALREAAEELLAALEYEEIEMLSTDVAMDRLEEALDAFAA